MMPAFWYAPSLTQPQGRTTAMPWSMFAERVERARAVPTKDELRRWAPTEFRGSYRCRANVLRVHAVVLDIDDGSPIERVETGLANVMFVGHSTFSATAERPRWRVVVPLDYPVNADEHDRVWRFLAAKVEATGTTPDYAARDASRAWAVPAVPPSKFYVTKVNDTAFASRYEALAAIPEPEPLPEPDRRGEMGSAETLSRRARRYLAEIPGAISGSQGHATTFWAALVLVRGFGLDPGEALELLVTEYNPRCSPPWSTWELRHKVKQALQRGRAPFGWLADRGRAA